MGATPVKRPRPSAASHSHGTPHLSSYRPSTPLSSSASRPLAPGPSRLNSSPRGPNAFVPSPLSVSYPSSPLGLHRTASSPATAAPSVPFLLRPNPFDLQEFLNSHLSLSTPAQNAGSAVRTKLFSRADPKAYMYRYMYERMMDRSEGARAREAEELELWADQELGMGNSPRQGDRRRRRRPARVLPDRRVRRPKRPIPGASPSPSPPRSPSPPPANPPFPRAMYRRT